MNILIESFEKSIIQVDINNQHYFQSVQNDSYDHHAAIYYLLQDRLTQSRNSATGSPSKHPNTNQAQRYLIHEQRRRPSNIAEQVSLTGHYNMQTDNNFQSLRDYSAPRPPISLLPHFHLQQLQQQHHHHQQQLQQQTTTQPTGNNETQPNHPMSQIDNSGGMIVSDFKCLTCAGPILENTTSTTTCVNCAMLRKRRRAFAHPWDSHQQQLMQQQQHLQHQNSQQHFQHLPLTESMGSERVRGPHDSRDSGVSSGSSQDYGDFTPTTEKSLIFPSRYSVGNRVSLDRQSVQFSQLVRKLSEVEGIVPNILMKTSIDEGVCIDESSKQFPEDPNLQDQMQISSNPDGSWKTQHQLSQGSTFDSISLDRSCSVASPVLEQLPYHCPIESTQESSDCNEKNLVQSSYLTVQSGASCSAFPPGSNNGSPLNNDLTASLPSCTHGGPILSSSKCTETTKNIQVGGGTSHSTSTNTAADMESSDLQGSADSPRTLQYVHQQQQYKYVPSYPQHLTPGMKRFLPQSHLQKQNLLSVLHAPHQMSSTLSPRRVRSPICFREGRRASDGYVGTCSPFNNTIAFPQRLYDKSKATGHFELHEVREEHRALQNQFGSGNRQNLLPDTNSALIPTCPNEDGVSCDTPPELAQGRLSAAKRISLPENFAYFSSTSGLVASTPTSSNTTPGNINVNLTDAYGASLAIQQQILQHRMRPSSSSGRRTSGRPNSYGFYPPQSHQQGLSSDFLFQPIAEDEADGVPLSPHEHCIPEAAKELSQPCLSDNNSKANLNVPSTLPLTSMALPSIPGSKDKAVSMDQDSKDPNWQTLTNDMEISCRLTDHTTTSKESNFRNDAELSYVTNEQSTTSISSEHGDQQYSFRQPHADIPNEAGGENMDISNMDK